MQITIQRPEIKDVTFTISSLMVDTVYFSDCLEDRDRGLYQADTLQYINSIKVKHETCIPYGTYQVIMSFSNKFQKYLPELLNVPGFEGIRIHSGNSEVDSSGCILLGIKQENKVVQSKNILTKFIKLIEATVKKEKVFITIAPTPSKINT